MVEDKSALLWAESVNQLIIYAGLPDVLSNNRNITPAPVGRLVIKWFNTPIVDSGS